MQMRREGGGITAAGRRAFVAALVALLLVLVASGCASRAGAPDAASTARTEGAASASTAQATAPSPAAPSVTLDAVGDVSLARGVVDTMQAYGAAYPFALVAPLIDGDVNLANLEGPLTDGGTPWAKGYNFRTPPRFAGALNAGRVGVVTIANNHVMDYGATGLLDTVAALDAVGVLHTGAGANARAARQPAVVEVRGLRVAILGYVTTPDEAGGFTIGEWRAGADSPGVAIGAADGIAADVAAARRLADFVVVAVHAGDEYRWAPNATQRALAEAALAAGADAYIGAHAHVPQPIERRGRQIIAWGLGNFVFALDNLDLANIPQPRVSMVLKLTLTKGLGVTSYDVVPVTLDASESRPRPATAAEAAALRAMVGG
ncbi:MAG: CapA family protein [Dehalococcoidia bacterium]|nr:CapA family protein [Dehalococcoidia bacterium]